MAGINEISCNIMNSNTGVPQCYLNPGKIEKVMLIPKGTQFTAADVLVLDTKLKDLAKNNSEASRGYPIGNFIGFEDKSQEATTNTTPYGAQIAGAEGKMAFLLQYDNGGMNFQKKLRTFEGGQGAYDLLIFDKKNQVVIGTTPDDTAYVLKGLSLDLIQNQMMKWHDGSNGAMYKIGFYFSDATELLDRLSYQVLSTGKNVMSINGLRDLELTVNTALAAGVVKLNVKTDGGAVNIYSTYGSSLQALTWTSAQELTGTAISVAVALDAVTQSLQFTLSGAGYTGLASGATLVIYSPTISAMTATVPGFANGSITLVKP
jgi:hypothetical protein